MRLTLGGNKGGSGKSMAALAVGYAAAARGVQTVIIDFDPQANATARLGITPEHAAAVRAHEVIQRGGSLADVAQPTPWHDNLRVVPGTPDLAVLEQTTAPTDLYRLADSLAGFDEDVLVILDTAPTTGNLLYQALIATELLLPTELDIDGIEGVAKVCELAGKVLRLNPNGRAGTARDRDARTQI